MRLLSMLRASPCVASLSLGVLFSLVLSGALALSNKGLVKGTAMCERLGVSDWQRYETSLLVTLNGATARAPLFASQSLDPRNNTDIRAAVIMIHGSNNDANRYFCGALKSFNASDMVRRELAVLCCADGL